MKDGVWVDDRIAQLEAKLRSLDPSEEGYSTQKEWTESKSSRFTFFFFVLVCLL